MTRKERAADRLLKAVAHWVEANGGKVLIVGGVEVQDFHEGKYKFRVAVRCAGRWPETDWADKLAQEWRLKWEAPSPEMTPGDEQNDLAALLRSVREETKRPFREVAKRLHADAKRARAEDSAVEPNPVEQRDAEWKLAVVETVRPADMRLALLQRMGKP